MRNPGSLAIGKEQFEIVVEYNGKEVGKHNGVNLTLPKRHWKKNGLFAHKNIPAFMDSLLTKEIDCGR